MKTLIFILLLTICIACNSSKTNFDKEKFFTFDTYLNKDMFLQFAEGLLVEAGYYIDLMDTDGGIINASKSGVTETKGTGFSLTIKLQYVPDKYKVKCSVETLFQEYERVYTEFYDMKHYNPELYDYFIPVLEKIQSRAKSGGYPNKPEGWQRD